jgi:hypothetical protein
LVIELRDRVLHQPVVVNQHRVSRSGRQQLGFLVDHHRHRAIDIGGNVGQVFHGTEIGRRAEIAGHHPPDEKSGGHAAG